MKLAIINTFNFHFEMFGHIIEYCLKKNIRIDIYSNFNDDLGLSTILLTESDIWIICLVYLSIFIDVNI